MWLVVGKEQRFCSSKYYSTFQTPVRCFYKVWRWWLWPEKAKTQAKGITLLKTLSNMFHLFKRHDVVGKHENNNNFTEFTKKFWPYLCMIVTMSTVITGSSKWLVSRATPWQHDLFDLCLQNTISVEVLPNSQLTLFIFLTLKVCMTTTSLLDLWNHSAKKTES